MRTSIILASFAQSRDECSIIYTLTGPCILTNDCHGLRCLQILLCSLKENIHKVILCHLSILLIICISQVVLENVFKTPYFTHSILIVTLLLNHDVLTLGTAYRLLATLGTGFGEEVPFFAYELDRRLLLCVVHTLTNV